MDLPNFDPLNPDHVRDAFIEAIGAETERSTALLEAYERAPETVEDEGTAAKVTDMVKQFRACAKAIEDKRKYHKTRYDACGKMVHAVASEITKGLAEHQRNLENRLTAYQRRIAEAERKKREEEERQRREEAERLEREAKTDEDIDKAIAAEEAARRAEREAQAKPADLTKSRGEYGSVASLRSVLAFEITQFGTVPLHELRPYLSRDAVERAIRGFMRDNADRIKATVKNGDGYGVLTGVRFYEDQQTRVR